MPLPKSLHRHRLIATILSKMQITQMFRGKYHFQIPPGAGAISKFTFQVGMKAEYIMTEEQRAQKRQRLLERESMENGVATPTSMHQDDMFLTYDNPEVSNRYDSISSMQDMKPILPSSKSSSGSSEYHPENQSK